MSIDIHALSGAYAVDALDVAERAEFERHLAVCASCQYEVDSLREAAAALSGVVEMTPTDRLRASVLDAISEVRPLPPVVSAATVASAKGVGRTRRWWAAGSLVLAASFASAVVVTHPWSSSHIAVSEADQVTTAADVQVVRTAVTGGGTLTWYRSSSLGKAVVTAIGLRPLAGARVYELWLERPNGSMVAAGFLTGSGPKVVLNGQASTAVGAGVTVEPTGGSVKPTLPPVSFAKFGDA